MALFAGLRALLGRQAAKAIRSDIKGFANLKSSLEGQDYTEASNASIALLIIFSDTLALLIGEQFATSACRWACLCWMT